MNWQQIFSQFVKKRNKIRKHTFTIRKKKKIKQDQLNVYICDWTEIYCFILSSSFFQFGGVIQQQSILRWWVIFFSLFHSLYSLLWWICCCFSWAILLILFFLSTPFSNCASEKSSEKNKVKIVVVHIAIKFVSVFCDCFIFCVLHVQKWFGCTRTIRWHVSCFVWCLTK